MLSLGFLHLISAALNYPGIIGIPLSLEISSFATKICNHILIFETWQNDKFMLDNLEAKLLHNVLIFKADSVQ